MVADDQPTFWDRVDAGSWEPGTLAALVPLLGPGVTFIDLGAWVGPLSLLAAARGAGVVAVEADPAAQHQLRRNLAVNPELAERIEVVEAAISPSPGTVRLGSRRKRGDSMSSVLLAEGPGAWTAPAVTPAMLAERLCGPEPRVIKIDIEGAEYTLLSHLGPLLSGQNVSVLVSFHPVILARAASADVAARAQDAVASFEGWEAFAIMPAGPVAQGPLQASRFSTDRTDAWLFRRP